GQPYTSARIVTRNLYEPRYGRIEARIKLPYGQGIWPAFWMLGNDHETVGWPQCGEVDIMEFLGHDTNTIHGTLHGPGYFGGGGISQSYTLPVGQFHTDFHVFAVEWEEDEIRWYMDDIHYHTLGPDDLGGNEWVFTHPFYIILNVAVGGNWPGSPDGTTIFPQTMLVDYVRVFEGSGGGSSCCEGLSRGNVDQSADGAVTLGDLTVMIDHLFITLGQLTCWEEGNLDGSTPEGPGSVTLGDLTYLIDHLFITLAPLPLCPVSVAEDVFVFKEDFGSNVTYQAFGGSVFDALEIDASTAYAGSRSLRITVPDPDDPSGSYAGGAFTEGGGLDLSQYNALTFWARASKEATLDVAGIGNDNTGTSAYTADVNSLALSTSWQQYTIPFPLAEKLVDERGLFFFAEGPEAGSGYQIWIDEVVFENLATITNPRPAIPVQTFNLTLGDTASVGNGTVVFDVNGTDVTVNAMPGYFSFSSTDETVASVDPDGIITAEGIGTATITADLGVDVASGTITVNVSSPADAPAVAAPVPSEAPASVISLYSDAYSDHPVDTWSADWDQADVDDYVIGNDSTKEYTNLAFAGIEFGTTTIDASAMTRFHMNVWTPDPTASPAVFKVKLVDFGANGVFGGGDDVEHEVIFGESTMDTETWVSLDIPLTDFVGLTTTEHIAQLIISGDPNTVYVDNIYFYNSGVAGEPTVAAPTPTIGAADVISLYSDAYADHPVDTWSAVWDQANVEDFVIGADSAKKYTNLVFAGIEFTTTTVDASAMTHFRMDVWTPDPTDGSSVFKVKLVDFGANGVWDGGGDDVEHEIFLDENVMDTGSWVTLDIPLSDFLDLTTTEHIAQLIISGDIQTVFVDNVFFHR
ncbi:family 16 glycosylhydrolase, partial [candidate division GN15 bacterium]|nr:family 16 glycosylhydrolase [candidate division GN15 bacterium]